jgi:Tfp pilus assembly protein PilF
VRIETSSMDQDTLLKVLGSLPPNIISETVMNLIRPLFRLVVLPVALSFIACFAVVHYAHSMASGSPPSPTATKGDGDKGYRQALDFIKQGKNAEALPLLENAWRNNPHNRRMLADYLCTLVWLGQYDKAIKIYEAQKSIVKDTKYLYRNMGKAFYETGDYRQALTSYDQAFSFDSSDVEALKGIIYTSAKLQDNQPALKAWLAAYQRKTIPLATLTALRVELMQPPGAASQALRYVQEAGIKDSQLLKSLEEDVAAEKKKWLELATEAYVYGYPLVLMETTKQVMTNVAAPEPSGRAPINQFGNIPAFPTPEAKDVVSPNVDTLYTIAWLDLAKEPMVLHVPDTKGCYYVMQMLDGWTEVFASPGKRTTGTKAGNFAIVGPGWQGTLPPGVREIKSPTNLAWIIGRTQTVGPSDFAKVHAIQKQYTLTPLSAFGKPASPLAPVAVNPQINMNLPPADQVGRMEAAAFFKTLAALLKDNPPTAADAPMVAKLAQLGIIPGQEFDMTKLVPVVAKGLEDSVKAAQEQIKADVAAAGNRVNGWLINLKLGEYGTDYRTRAATALMGLGANLAKDAVYAMISVDGDGKPLNGAHRYVLQFAKGQTPPVNAFWSVTLYNSEHFLVANPIHRYSVSSWMRKLKRNRDGSLDILIQPQSPGKPKEANWLPAPSGDFNLILRMYWPKEPVLTGAWKPPAVKPAE